MTADHLALLLQVVGESAEEGDELAELLDDLDDGDCLEALLDDDAPLPPAPPDDDDDAWRWQWEDRRTSARDRPRCGARTRSGGACQRRAVWDDERDRPRNGRCWIHGGASTGPRTEAGREAIRASNRRRAETSRAATSCPTAGDCEP